LRALPSQKGTTKKAAKQTAADNATAFASQIPVRLLEAFNAKNRINQYLIDNIAPEVWKAKPPDGKGRTISAIVAHMLALNRAASRSRYNSASITHAQSRSTF
jgi:hypothetical protein